MPTPGQVASKPADRDADLAAAGARQKWAQREQVAERVLVEPAPPLDALVAEVTDIGGRAEP